jgi:hypothetical protein
MKKFTEMAEGEYSQMAEEEKRASLIEVLSSMNPDTKEEMKKLFSERSLEELEKFVRNLVTSSLVDQIAKEN